MIEPFDERGHDALLQASRIKPVARDGLTHKLVWRDRLTKPLCDSDNGTRLSADWRLVSCQDCRGAGEAASA